MAFIMPACRNFKSGLLFALLLLAASMPLQADNIFSINNPKVVQIGNAYVLNADIEYPLTPRVIEALEHGVSITFFQEFELYHSQPLLGQFWDWETSLWQVSLRYELRYHALAERYIIKSLDTHSQLSFVSLNDALKSLGHIRNLSLPPEHTTEPEHLKLRLRSGLDLNALPTPMRPGALLSNKWQLTSPWVEALWQ